jgi:hypothetical protein
MACLRNALGQPLCNVVEHPDDPRQSFCATCNLRFQNSRSLSTDTQSNSRSNQQLSSALTDIITGVLALFLAAVINTAVKSTEVQRPPVQDATLHTWLFAASETSTQPELF